MAAVATELALLTKYCKHRGRLTLRQRQAAMKTAGLCW